MRQLTAGLLCLALLLCCSGCGLDEKAPERKQYTATFLTLFDTVTVITGKAESEEAFTEKAQAVKNDLERFHRLFDIYHEYEGVVNLKTLNDQAAEEPIAVDPILMDLLLDCKEYYTATDGRVNTAMGSVLRLWHEARNDGIDDPRNAYLPDQAALEEAALHCRLEDVVLDPDASTVYFRDPALKLDVGAIAKGWAVQRVSETAPAGLLISVGGNVCATGPKDESGTPWVIGIQDPEGGDSYLHTIYLEKGSVVTSGDYQRGYYVDGQLYHHIIDPDTLYPSRLWRSVSIVCGDSGLADALSTALFLMDREAGQQLLTQFGAEAMWVSADGTIFYSPGFESLIRT